MTSGTNMTGGTRGDAEMEGERCRADQGPNPRPLKPEFSVPVILPQHVHVLRQDEKQKKEEKKESSKGSH